jgi:hypothetical protein
VTATGQEYAGLRDRLVAVETKLDIVLDRLGDGHLDHEARIRALESRTDHADRVDANAAQIRENAARIRGLERFRWAVTGAAATGGGALGALVAQLIGVH